MIQMMHRFGLFISLAPLLLLANCVAGEAMSIEAPATPAGAAAASLAISPSIFLTDTETALPQTPLTTPENSHNQLNLDQMNESEWASTSPDGQWVAVGLAAFPKPNTGGQQAYVRLMIFSTDGNVNWTIVDNWEELGLGFPTPAPLKWSDDGQSFYFTHRVNPDGCSAFPYYTDLHQVNLGDGIVNELLPPVAAALALAPDDSQVAYFIGGEKELVIKDLSTGEERKTKIGPGKDFNAGNILWSPDGSSLTLTLAINPCVGEAGVSNTVWAESTSIIWIDAETLEQRVLVNEDPRLFVTWEWNEPEKITIVDGQEDSFWQLDVNTGEITRD